MLQLLVGIFEYTKKRHDFLQNIDVYTTRICCRLKLTMGHERRSIEDLDEQRYKIYSRLELSNGLLGWTWAGIVHDLGGHYSFLVLLLKPTLTESVVTSLDDLARDLRSGKCRSKILLAYSAGACSSCEKRNTPLEIVQQRAAVI
ncbi:hypothetical protein J6590_023531 [Homalodisca vitripennis]|nr:hypothetical protein J6590_023531 [Homalodisca vitripennis]